jgi:hypothetical protein
VAQHQRSDRHDQQQPRKPVIRFKGKPSNSTVLVELAVPRKAATKFLVAIAHRTAYLMTTFRPFFFGPAPTNRRIADKKSSKT